MARFDLSGLIQHVGRTRTPLHPRQPLLYLWHCTHIATIQNKTTAQRSHYTWNRGRYQHDHWWQPRNSEGVNGQRSVMCGSTNKHEEFRRFCCSTDDHGGVGSATSSRMNASAFSCSFAFHICGTLCSPRFESCPNLGEFDAINAYACQGQRTSPYCTIFSINKGQINKLLLYLFPSVNDTHHPYKSMLPQFKFTIKYTLALQVILSCVLTLLGFTFEER